MVSFCDVNDEMVMIVNCIMLLCYKSYLILFVVIVNVELFNNVNYFLVYLSFMFM